MSKHLWEFEHPFYCSESEYRTPGPDHGLLEYESWGDFLEEWDESDPDMNLVFRWDWHTKAEREEAHGWEHYSEEEKAEHGELYDLLEIFIVYQRKGYFQPIHVRVTDEDELSVRIWLKKRSETILSFWKDLDANISFDKSPHW